MIRVRSVWSGGVGLPGYTNLYFGSGTDGAQAEADAAAADVHIFWDTISRDLPLNVRINVDPSVDVINPATGELTTTLTTAQTPPTAPPNTATPNYAAPAGAVVTWHTPGIVNGHRVKGRTFLVPLSRDAMDAEGSIQTNSLTLFRAAAAALISTTLAGRTALVAWHRPKLKVGGAAFAVTSASVPDKIAILTSRRG